MPVFKGLHGIFSFDSQALDAPIWILFPILWESPGARFVNCMTTPFTIGYFWKLTTIDWQPSDVWAAALTACDSSTGYDQWYDYLPGYGYVSPDIDNPIAFILRRWQC